MRIAFFSDTHLGHRRFGRVDERSGLNVRELDVMRTFERFLKSISEEQPDVVLHGGDFFDMVRPGNHTILKAFSAVSAFQRKRDGAEFIGVAGNHEVPRVQGTGCILTLLEEIPGVRVFWNRPEIVTIERDGERVGILCVPHSRSESAKELVPCDGVERLLLLAHGLTSNVPRIREASIEVGPFKKSCDLILLGDYHIHRTEGRKVVYVGSTDYVSANIWEEAKQPKGWILLDTKTMKWTFNEVQPARAVRDLAPIDVSTLGVTEVLDQMLRAMEELRDARKWDRDSLPIVRQRILNAPEGFRREVPFEVLQTLRGMAFDYVLDVGFHESKKQTEATDMGAHSVEEHWTTFAREYETPEGVDREQFVATGLAYLKEARNDTEADSA
ncbi:MAG: hypothetical protein C4341_05905 [Armatimonadota bacterium]